MTLTHFNEEGRAHMVDISSKEKTERLAIAHASVGMKKETIRMIQEGSVKKGDVLAVAQVAGIMAAKKTSELIPMTHPINLTSVDITFNIKDDTIRIESSVKTTGKTGVEMEALIAVSTAALTIYDMCKAVDKGMIISNIMLMKKIGGKSGLYERKK